MAELTQLLTYCQFLPGLVADAPASLWWSSLFLAATDTGERISALLSANCANCDLTARTLRIQGNKTKTGKGRCYPLRLQTVEAIRKIHSPAQGLIWKWPFHRRHFYTVARKIMEGAGLKCGLNHDLFHSWRRYCISYTAALGNLEMARRQAGHPSVATTLAYYVDPEIAEQKGAANVLPDIPILDLQEPPRGENIGPAKRFRGVQSKGCRFEARLPHGGKKLYLGLYRTAEDAARAYNKQAALLFGSAAKLNVVPDEAPAKREPALSLETPGAGGTA